jgi:hypothetical protein
MPNTTFNIYRANPNSPDTHLDTYSNKIMGNYKFAARSTNCRILFSSGSTPEYFAVFKFDASLSN